MENILENKAKFFAQHWGQNVQSYKLTYSWKRDVKVDGYATGYLTLKPLSSITDNDALELAKISLYDPKIEGWNSEEVWIGEGHHDSNGDHFLEIGMRCWYGLLKVNDVSGSITLHDEDGEMNEIYNVSAVPDFLRSKGYGMPWMGLSVEKMVEHGWIKLKEC